MTLGIIGILIAIAGIAGWRIVQWVILVAGFLLVLFECRFFRVPKRTVADSATNPDELLSPADGTIVAIEEVFEDEILNEKRLQVSIFMSIWNVHINWFPVSGFVEYFRHHHGKFMVAWHPKSSTDNERTTTVVRTHSGSDEKMEGHRILFRQIAGFVARRIVNHSQERQEVKRGEECGFIKFGSRVDIFLPLGSEIHVKLNEKVTGTQTKIATLPDRKTTDNTTPIFEN